MTRGRAPFAAVLLLAGAAAAVLAASALQAAPIKGLSQAPLLARAYDLVYDADFAGADAALKQACPPAPAQACAVIDVAARWWRIYLDIDNRRLDAAFMARVNATIDGGEQWVAREPERAEAWFYLGAAYGSRVQYHARRSEYFAAARDGKRIKHSLERAIRLDPDLHDAYFGVGLYQYYADIAPTVLKLVRWLLLLPGGDKAEGLAQMRQARNRGTLLTAEAAYQLHLIDLWYEHTPGDALALLDQLRARYPHNPLFVQNAAQVHDIYRSDRPAALAAYRALVDGARGGTLREPVLAETWGHLGAAAQLRAMSEPGRAIDEAQWVIDHTPAMPYGAVALAHLETARAWASTNQREKAVAAYRAAMAAAPPGDPRHVRRDAESALAKLR
jgi:tetratricopeptide (TPR) repeat protein